MEYRNLGNTGLKISCIGFGNYLNSDDPDNLKRNIDLIKKAWDLGINFFDTAEVYGCGEGEKQLGLALKQLNVPRDKLVITTKIFWGVQSWESIKPNEVGLSRKHIIEGLKKSLLRLQLDYVDVVYAHRFDSETPLEETVRAFDWCVKQGLAHYWGTSEWSAANIFEAFAICYKFNLTLPVVEQPEYNMFNRLKIEKDYTRLFDNYKYGSTIFCPLAGGILTGKYNNGIPQDSRVKIFEKDFMIQQYFQEFFGEEKKENTITKINKLAEIAKKLNMTLAQLSMSWILVNKDISSAITSATKLEQLDDTVKAVQLYKNLSGEDLKNIEDILQNRPEPDMNFREFKQKSYRR